MSEHMAKRTGIDEAQLARIAATSDPLASWQRDIVGSSARIHLPLRDVVGLRDQAKALRILASKLEVLSQSREEDWRVLHQAREAIKLTDRLVRTGNAGKD